MPPTWKSGRGWAKVATMVACVAVTLSLSACGTVITTPGGNGDTSELSRANNLLVNRGFANVSWNGYSADTGYSFDVTIKNCHAIAVVKDSDVTVQLADSSGKNQTLHNSFASQIRQDKRFKYCAK